MVTKKYYSGFIIIQLIICFIIFGCNSKKENNKEIHDKSEYVNSQLQTDGYLERGKLVYDKNCKVCHQLNLKGIPGTYPPLVENENVAGDKGFLVGVLLNGVTGEIKVNGKKYNGIMASYKTLTDQEISDVLNYIRTRNEPDLDLISKEDVSRMR